MHWVAHWEQTCFEYHATHLAGVAIAVLLMQFMGHYCEKLDWERSVFGHKIAGFIIKTTNFSQFPHKPEPFKVELYIYKKIKKKYTNECHFNYIFPVCHNYWYMRTCP